MTSQNRRAVRRSAQTSGSTAFSSVRIAAGMLMPERLELAASDFE
jgi:hypothetical protein